MRAYKDGKWDTLDVEEYDNYIIEQYNKINQIAGENELIRKEHITEITRGYLNKSDGAFVSSTNWRASDFIIVKPTDKVYYSGETVSDTASCVIGYDELGDFISELLPKGDYTEEEIIIPNNVFKIRASSTYDSLRLSVKKDENVVYEYKNNGLSWLSVGDSITYLNGSYQEIVSETINFKSIFNEGHSGSPLTGGLSHNSINSLITNMIEADIYTLLAGTNDFKLNAPLGNIDDYINNTGELTFYGSLRIYIDLVLSINPKSRIYLMTNLHRNNDGYTSFSTNTEGHKLSDYNNAIKWLCSTYGFNLIDLNENSGITWYNLNLTTIDGLHPNGYGFTLIAEHIIKKFNFNSKNS